MKTRITIFGAGGFLGSQVSSYFESLGFEVTRLSSSLKHVSSPQYFSVEDPRILKDLTPPNFIVYLSWSTERAPRTQRLSFLTATQVSKWAKEHNVKALFISSLAAESAVPRSNYGRYKKFAEKVFLLDGHVVIRPATVTSEGIEGGSALRSLANLPTPIRYLMGIFSPITFPIVELNIFLSEASNSLRDNSLNPLRSVISGERVAFARSRFISFCLPKNVIFLLAHWLPHGIRDRLLTLQDLDSSYWASNKRPCP